MDAYEPNLNHTPATYTFKEYREAGMRSLKGHWGIAIGVMIVAAILGGFGSGGLSYSVNFNVSGNEVEQMFSSNIFGQALDWMSQHRGLISFLSILSMAQFIIGGTIELGYDRFCLHLADGEEAKFGDLFSAFDIFGQAFWLRLRISIQVMLWTFLFIIPGIVAMYRYSMATYIMAEYPGISAGEAIERSKAMMDGHKKEYFLLQLSFIGWIILSALTLGVLSIWLTPYMHQTYAVYYRNLSGSRNPAPAPEENPYDWTQNY